MAGRRNFSVVHGDWEMRRIDPNKINILFVSYNSNSGPAPEVGRLYQIGDVNCDSLTLPNNNLTRRYTGLDGIVKDEVFREAHARQLIRNVMYRIRGFVYDERAKGGDAFLVTVGSARGVCRRVAVAEKLAEIVSMQSGLRRGAAHVDLKEAVDKRRQLYRGR